MYGFQKSAWHTRAKTVGYSFFSTLTFIILQEAFSLLNNPLLADMERNTIHLFIHIHSFISSFKRIPRHEWAEPIGRFGELYKHSSVFPRAW